MRSKIERKTILIPTTVFLKYPRARPKYKIWTPKPKMMSNENPTRNPKVFTRPDPTRKFYNPTRPETRKFYNPTRPETRKL